MNQLLYLIIGISWLAGFTAFLGSLIAYFERAGDSETKQEVIKGIVALGGGILLAAVAFALAPRAIEILDIFTLTVTFCAGGLVFCIVDALIANKSGNKAQLMAMLLDFIPEAISMGAVFGQNRDMGFLLGGFIAAQNLPEGFNSFREMKESGLKPSKILTGLFAVSFLGPLAAVTGYYFLQDQQVLTAGIMSFASGGILYLIFQDIAPQSTMKKHWIPPFGAVIGFAIGMIGHKLLS
ncbi:divalent cation transporter [Rhodohalobacter sp.]|uniref:ZIP family metal transporter n=1 Tax=Rhodohalobacter sp. TaxID=1974210 RepID=UPI002ACDFE18|nr:divalent cation transporter [Rhodohalobacter sp.]MDZ7755554.1 divalent cation transporter [Rhodohalobacter sp.]